MSGAAPTPFDRTKGALRYRGVAWQRRADTGEWERHVLRSYPDGTPYWSKTFRLVDATRPFCLQCLSVNVQPVSTDGEVLYCHDCDIDTFWVMPEGWSE